MAPSADDIISQRQVLADYWSEAHNRFDELIEAYHGNYQKLWPGEFRRGESPKVANWIKVAWDRYAKMVGKLPTNHVTPSKVRRVSQAKADKVEKILSYYDASSGAANLFKWYAWYLVGLGASVFGVMPDPTLKGPRFFVKDPRTVYPSPGAGSIPGTSTAYGMQAKPIMATMSLHSVVMDETVTPTYLLDQYRTETSRLTSMLKGSSISTPQSLTTYMDKDYWVVLVNGKTLLSVEHELGFVPIRYTMMYVPDQLGGQSQFEQNIGLVLAYMRILNQKLTYNQNVVWPWLVTKGLNDMDRDNRTIEILDPAGDAAFLSPPAELQAERDLDVLDRLIRIMNHDTESMQGEPPGSIVTGSAVRELNRDVRTMVSDYWETMKPDVEFVKSGALIIDEELYGGTEKPMFGRVRGEQFEEKYTPSKDIAGNHNVVVDFGIGVGGMEGFVELMQTAAQGYADEQTVMENLPWIRSVSDTRRKVMMDRLEKLIMEATASGAPVPIINHLTSWRVAIEDGKDPWKWIAENPMPNPEQPELPELPPGAEGLEGLGAGPTPAGGLPGQPPGIPQPPPVQPAPSPQQLLALVQGRGRQ